MAFPHDGRKFVKGQSGNPKRKPHKIPELRELLANVLGDEKDGKSAAEAILMALRNKAIKGDVRAAELLLDRAYGKVKDIDNRPNDLVITISGPTPE
jgi:hypothetical protein